MQTTAEATPQAAIAGNASSFTAEENYAAGLAVECFGAEAPETLRFVKHIVERSGKTWLTDRAPADPVTPEAQA